MNFLVIVGRNFGNNTMTCQSIVTNDKSTDIVTMTMSFLDNFVYYLFMYHVYIIVLISILIFP